VTCRTTKAAATLAMTVSATGRIAISTIPLLTVDEVDAHRRQQQARRTARPAPSESLVRIGRSAGTGSEPTGDDNKRQTPKFRSLRRQR